MVLYVKRINHLFHCHQIIPPFPEYPKLSLVIQSHVECPLVNSSPSPTPPVPFSTFSLKLSAKFKTFPPLFFRAQRLISKVHISHFLVRHPLNHSTQPGEVKASCDPLPVLSGGLLGASQQLCPLALCPKEGAHFGPPAHIFSPTLPILRPHFIYSLASAMRT